ncbi:nucleotide-binding domain-containing protein [Massarina eburnea CBS 473.64]|uniref:Nucleotide-binding domain-containing protein n=1 Tax=Massarina eburnea CBS 473.64 TaxID=1395130 RepID=A0A6A6RSQ0_9PLEO|nr:nucleotide-binding domain-containing protein [Massarina eburnea CBS 473.64]
MPHILIIGAGVIGLQTANTFLDAGYKDITILSKHWPGDESIEYTSPWAGVIWRTHATPDKQPEVLEWNKESYRTWLDIAENRADEAEKMGIQKVPLTVFSNDEELDTTNKIWYTTLVKNFTILPTSEIVFNGPKTGFSFTSIAINPTRYLSHLLARAQARGVKTISADLPTSKGFPHALSAAIQHLQNADKNIATDDIVVINSTGLNAHTLCADTALYPIRGQTLLVRITPAPPFPRIILYDNDPVAYLIPRTGTDMYLLGGTTDAENWAPEPITDVSGSILERCGVMMKGWADDEAEIEVVRAQVGLRPGRRGGARVEREVKSVELKVVHQYGHAGSGYQNALGSSKKALRLVKEYA